MQFLRGILDIMMILMTLIIMKNENPPSDYHSEGKLSLQPMEHQQGENDKTPLEGQCSLEEWWSHTSQDGRLVSNKLGIGGQAPQSVVEQYVIGFGGTPKLNEGRRPRRRSSRRRSPRRWNLNLCQNWIGSESGRNCRRRRRHRHCRRRLPPRLPPRRRSESGYLGRWSRWSRWSRRRSRCRRSTLKTRN